MPDAAADYINNIKERLVFSELITQHVCTLVVPIYSESRVTVIEEHGIQVTGILLYYRLKKFIVSQHCTRGVCVSAALLSTSLQADLPTAERPAGGARQYTGARMSIFSLSNSILFLVSAAVIICCKIAVPYLSVYQGTKQQRFGFLFYLGCFVVCFKLSRAVIFSAKFYGQHCLKRWGGGAKK